MTIFGEHWFGVFGDMRVIPAVAESGGLLTFRIEDADVGGNSIFATEPLDRADVERLRDLLTEALA